MARRRDRRGEGEEPAYPGAFAVTEPNEPHGLKAVEGPQAGAALKK